MPTIGSFHGKYWRARAGGAPPPTSGSQGSYCGWQASVIVGCLNPWTPLAPLWDHLRWYWRLATRLWQWRAPASRQRLEAWIDRLDTLDTECIAAVERVITLCAQPASRDSLSIWITRLETCSADHANVLNRLAALPAEPWLRIVELCDDEQRAVFRRVAAAVSSRYWGEALGHVRACATSPKFHQPEQWVEYSRALKANIGQAQNVFRHIKVVHALKAAHPEMSNPDAHLFAELAYQGMTHTGRPARIVDHPRRIIEHEKTVVTH